MAFSLPTLYFLLLGVAIGSSQPARGTIRESFGGQDGHPSHSHGTCSAAQEISDKLTSMKADFQQQQSDIQQLQALCSNASSEISDRLTSIQADLQELRFALNESTKDDKTEKGPPVEGFKGYPKDCNHAYQQNGRSHLFEGVHLIQPENYPEPFAVYCEVQDGAAWTVIQRRQDGSVDFARDWQTYKLGFGDVTGEHWLGNEKIYYLVQSGGYRLRIDVQDWGTETVLHAEYGVFGVGSESSKYVLSVGNYSGTAGDHMAYHDGQKFSTKDQDNDDHANHCCACTNGWGRGGWWYRTCHRANLNGVYIQGGTYNGWYGLSWGHVQDHSQKRTVMKVLKGNSTL